MRVETRVQKALEHGLVRGTRRQGEHKSASQCLLHVFGVSSADPGLRGRGGGTDGECGWGGCGRGYPSHPI